MPGDWEWQKLETCNRGTLKPLRKDLYNDLLEKLSTVQNSFPSYRVLVSFIEWNPRNLHTLISYAWLHPKVVIFVV